MLKKLGKELQEVGVESGLGGCDSEEQEDIEERPTEHGIPSSIEGREVKPIHAGEYPPGAISNILCHQKSIF